MDWLRKQKLKWYKNKKIREDKTFTDRHYAIKFRLKINDKINPIIVNDGLEILIPAKATFFAKRKLKKYILHKIDVIYDSIEKLTYEEWQHYERDKEEYESKTKG